jgi:hypothetical protein
MSIAKSLSLAKHPHQVEWRNVVYKFGGSRTGEDALIVCLAGDSFDGHVDLSECM